MGLSLVRILKLHKESQHKRKAELFSNVTSITKILEDEKFIQSRRALRKSKVLNDLKDGIKNTTLISQIDIATEDSARYVATTYDRLGFILKHDDQLEEEFINWQSYIVADMWLLTKALVTDKWRVRNKTYLKEFERLGNLALQNENIDKTE
jgi:hypothetical protein